MTDLARHWDSAYGAGERTVSWYQERAESSLARVQQVCSPESAVIDVGGGASRLTDGLLEAGFEDVTVLDISQTGMTIARQRLGAAAGRVQWIESDVLTWEPAPIYDFWHDRAVFHFLTADADRERYRETMLAALRPAAHVLIGAFAEDGPEQCSGLPVRRHTAAELQSFFGAELEEIDSWSEIHRTPRGGVQPFNWYFAKLS